MPSKGNEYLVEASRRVLDALPSARIHIIGEGELQPALERAFASGKPALVNVLTDPDVAYPRNAVLA